MDTTLIKFTKEEEEQMEKQRAFNMLSHRQKEDEKIKAQKQRRRQAKKLKAEYKLVKGNEGAVVLEKKIQVSQ